MSGKTDKKLGEEVLRLSTELKIELITNFMPLNNLIWPNLILNISCSRSETKYI